MRNGRKNILKAYRVSGGFSEALGRIGNPKAVDHLIMALDDTDIDVKIAAIRSLSGFPEEGVFKAIRESYRPSRRERQEKCCLGPHKTEPLKKGAQVCLHGPSHDESWVVRKTAARSMIGVADEGLPGHPH